MKLDQKYFVPFMLVGAIITMIFIVYASFNFKAKQEANFRNNVSEFETLMTDMHPVLASEDSLNFNELAGKKVVLVFWASWSEKSAQILEELDQVAERDDVQIVGATVKDATETAEEVLPAHDFIFIDAAKLFNDLKVPGIPSYILFDEEGNPIDVTIGYKEGVADRINTVFAR